MFLTIIIFILILGLLIFAHEFGHFLMAKRAGIRVDEFGFGFPPRLFTFKKNETIYSLNLIPLGGFVKIYGEDRPKEIPRDEEKAFYSKPIGVRTKILVAGVIFNLILAVLLLSIGHKIGLPTVIDENLEARPFDLAQGKIYSGTIKNPKIRIIGVAADSPAEKAGLRMGDAIIRFQISDFRFQVNEVKEVQDFIEQYKGQEIIVTLERGKEILNLAIVPRQNPPEGQGPIGIALAKTAIISYPLYQAVIKGILDVVNLTTAIIVALAGILYRVVTGLPVGLEVAGPVGIFALTSQAAKLGFIYLLQLTAFLSINLAIINSLPFPALDGGRLLFLAIEKIKGSPVSSQVERTIHTIGFAFLIALMLLITLRDLTKIF